MNIAGTLGIGCVSWPMHLSCLFLFFFFAIFLEISIVFLGNLVLSSALCSVGGLVDLLLIFDVMAHRCDIEGEALYDCSEWLPTFIPEITVKQRMGKPEVR